MSDPTVFVLQRLLQQRDGRVVLRNEPAQGRGSSGANVGVARLLRLEQCGARCPSLGSAGYETQHSKAKQLRVFISQSLYELAFLCQTVHNLEQVARGWPRAARFGGVLESNHTVPI